MPCAPCSAAADMLPLVIVRPEPGASETAGRAAELGLDARTIPLFSAESRAWTAPDPRAFDALLLTSANAARYAGPQLAGLATLPCHVVGPATAAAARAAGLVPVVTGTAGAQPLVDAMVAGGARSILWLAGAERTALTSGAARITPVTVYAMRPIAAGPEWAAATQGPAIMMLHSARAAQHVAALAGAARKHMIVLAISAPVAAAAGDGWRAVHVAAAPGDAAMLALAAKLCQMPGP